MDLFTGSPGGEREIIYKIEGELGLFLVPAGFYVTPVLFPDFLPPTISFFPSYTRPQAFSLTLKHLTNW